MSKKVRLALYISILSLLGFVAAFYSIAVAYAALYYGANAINWTIFTVLTSLFVISMFFPIIALWAASDYRTPDGTIFKPSFGIWCIAIHTPTSRYLRDPKTGKWCWCRNVLFVKDPEPKSTI